MSTTDKADLPDVTAGDDAGYDLAFTDDQGNAIDISGWTVTLTIKQRPSQSTPVVQKSVSSHDDAANGKTSVGLTASETSEMDGHYVYDIRVERADGTVQTVVKGGLEVTETVHG